MTTLNSLLVNNWAALFVAAGAQLRVPGGTLTLGGSRALLQIGIDNRTAVLTPVDVGLFQGVTQSELFINVDPAFTWTPNPVNVLAATNGQGNYFISGQPRDAATYSLVFQVSNGAWTRVGILRTPSSPPPPIVCAPNVCGNGSNCRNCAACGGDPNGNAWCCQGGAAPNCLFQKDSNTCELNQCPLGPPPSTTTFVSTTPGGTTTPAATTTVPSGTTTSPPIQVG